MSVAGFVALEIWLVSWSAVISFLLLDLIYPDWRPHFRKNREHKNTKIRYNNDKGEGSWKREN